MIKAVTFDLDDTLWDNQPVMVEAESAMYTWLQQHCKQLTEQYSLARLKKLKDELLAETPELAHDVSELRRHTLEQALIDCGYGSASRKLAEQAFAQFLTARQQVTYFPHTENTLQQLSQQYSLGVITNGNAEISQMSIGQYFSFAIKAEDLKISKPAPIIFSKAVSLAGVKPHQIAHIGDHPIHDILGAHQAGFKSVWFNPQQDNWEYHEHQPDAIAHSIHEIPALIDKLSNKE
ncbi:HAD-IA family hydrolase [Zooshikella marina]|uniref:HAD family hydrolase n=1 Tax=Zooshikella ganghwensis TaxID=202772 RepID=UPI001BAF691A|nr:HAD-IA family hydrolase [Zooshikella ganghwensis]MBU2708215.1 HAD-IA family hydrolase [Zooshikella ganghwensis]